MKATATSKVVKLAIAISLSVKLAAGTLFPYFIYFKRAFALLECTSKWVPDHAPCVGKGEEERERGGRGDKLFTYPHFEVIEDLSVDSVESSDEFEGKVGH